MCQYVVCDNCNSNCFDNTDSKDSVWGKKVITHLLLLPEDWSLLKKKEKLAIKIKINRIERIERKIKRSSKCWQQYSSSKLSMESLNFHVKSQQIHIHSS